MARMKRANFAATGAPRPLQAEAALRRMSWGEPARRQADGSWQLGGRPVAPDVIAALAREELVRIAQDTAHATELGIARIERTEVPDRPNRWLERAGRAGRQTLLRDRLESPLAWLLRRRLVTNAQFAAGERLRGDWQLARALPSVTMRWDLAVPRGAGGTGPGDPTAAMLDARERVAVAMAAVGPGLGCVLERVVCQGEGLSAAERAMGWPARAGKVVLGLALDRLAAHYRIEPGGPPAAHAGQPRQRNAARGRTVLAKAPAGDGKCERPA